MRAGWHYFWYLVTGLCVALLFIQVWEALLDWLLGAAGWKAESVSWIGDVRFAVVILLSAFSAKVLIDWLFRKVIPAECPECGGRFRLQMEEQDEGWHWIYECAACGYRWD